MKTTPPAETACEGNCRDNEIGACQIGNGKKVPVSVAAGSYDIVIVGSGAPAVAVASNLLGRSRRLSILLIEPAEPYERESEKHSVLARGVERTVHSMKAAVAAFNPSRRAVVLDDCRVIRYRKLIVCPAPKLDSNAIQGLPETLGHNGVTSAYRRDLAPYTLRLLYEHHQGRALFTQPSDPMDPGGMAQSVMYLCSHYWRRNGWLNRVEIEFYSVRGMLFSMSDYAPALMEYVERYGIALNFGFQLYSINGASKFATFRRLGRDGTQEFMVRQFDMLHIVPPQTAPNFIRASPLSDDDGWIDVNHVTLRHRYADIFAFGDVTNTPNCKTVSASLRQARVVAHNVLASLGKARGAVTYDGYSACPLTVERGKLILAESLYGDKPARTWRRWLIRRKRPSRLAWLMTKLIATPLHGQLPPID
jgi:sulfide:quinone oxidoreductase